MGSQERSQIRVFSYMCLSSIRRRKLIEGFEVKYRRFVVILKEPNLIGFLCNFFSKGIKGKIYCTITAKSYLSKSDCLWFTCICYSFPLPGLFCQFVGTKGVENKDWESPNHHSNVLTQSAESSPGFFLLLARLQIKCNRLQTYRPGVKDIEIVLLPKQVVNLSEEVHA